MRRAFSSRERSEASRVGGLLFSKEIDRRTKSRTAMPRAHRRSDTHLPSGSDPERADEREIFVPLPSPFSCLLSLSEPAKIADCCNSAIWPSVDYDLISVAFVHRPRRIESPSKVLDSYLGFLPISFLFSSGLSRINLSDIVGIFKFQLDGSRTANVPSVRFDLSIGNTCAKIGR